MFLYVTRFKRKLGHFPVEEIKLEARAASTWTTTPVAEQEGQEPSMRALAQSTCSFPPLLSDAQLEELSPMLSSHLQFRTPAKAWLERTYTILIIH